MNDQYYKDTLLKALEELLDLKKQQEAIEIQIAKREEFFRVTANMLSDAERDKFLAVMAKAKQDSTIRESGLTAAIRKVLTDARSTNRYFTVAEVRDLLQSSSFDFSQYVSNPLASVSTTLRRMKPDELESIEVQNVTAYRLKNSFRTKRPKGLGARILDMAKRDQK